MRSETVTDHWVNHPEGRIFARQWHPPVKTVAAPIIMLHDSLGCTELWRDFPAALCTAASRRVIAYDRLGFGQSDARTGKPSLDFVVEEAARYFPAVREQMDIDRFAVLGHSVGGGMSIQIAARMPEACDALITIAAQVFAEDRTLAGIAAAKQQFTDPRQVERLSKYHGKKSRWVLDAWIDNWLDPEFGAWTLAGVLPQVRCPALVIHGELDEYGSTVHPKTIERLCGGPTRVELLEGRGHVPFREQPVDIALRVSTFLETSQRPID